LHNSTPSDHPSRQYGVFLAEQEAHFLRFEEAAEKLDKESPLVSAFVQPASPAPEVFVSEVSHKKPLLLSTRASSRPESLGLLGRESKDSPADLSRHPTAPGHKCARPLEAILKIIPGCK
jgi:hypothetical protein